MDAVAEQPFGSGVEADDIVDCGNSLWPDTIRCEKQYAERWRFFGSGASGGEVGARFGYSLMPGGHPVSCEHLRPIWEAIAATVDPKTGTPLETGHPASPSPGENPAPRTWAPDGQYVRCSMLPRGFANEVPLATREQTETRHVAIE